MLERGRLTVFQRATRTACGGLPASALIARLSAPDDGTFCEGKIR